MKDTGFVFSDGILTIIAASPADGHLMTMMANDMRAEGFDPTLHVEVGGGVTLSFAVQRPDAMLKYDDVPVVAGAKVIGREVVRIGPLEAKIEPDFRQKDAEAIRLAAVEQLLAAKAKLQQKETEQRILGAIGSFTTREHGGL